MSPTKHQHGLAPTAAVHVDELLDEALQETFPASDPISVAIEPDFPESGPCPPAEAPRQDGSATVSSKYTRKT